MSMNRPQLDLLVEYLDARERAARMRANQMDGGDSSRLREAEKDEREALKKLALTCPPNSQS